MGKILTGECPCGFRSRDLNVGCGMEHSDYYGVPVACSKCHRLWIEDVRSIVKKLRTYSG